MVATTSPGPRATDPNRSPSAGMQFAVPARPTPSENVTQPDGSLIPSLPPTGGDGNPPGGRRRTKSTTELLSAFEELKTQGAALEAELRDRKQSLEAECYTALGSALFAQRADDQIAAAYKSITAPFGVRLRRKFDELAKLTDVEG